MFLHGTHRHQLDAKFRLRLPAKMRAELGGRFVVMTGTNGCLYVFGADYFDEKIASKIEEIPSFDTEYQDAVRRLTTSVEIPEEDGQGRFVLPSELREFGDINKAIVIVGVGKRAEIWSEERWEQQKKGQLVLSEENVAFDGAMKKLQEFKL